LDQVLINVLNGAELGLLLFMLSSGLTLIFSMMGVLNFAHASFYMLGAYVAYMLTGRSGFWVALVLAPLVVGALGALFERYVLRGCTSSATCPNCWSPSACPTCCWSGAADLGPRSACLSAAEALLQGPAFTSCKTPPRGAWCWARRRRSCARPAAVGLFAFPCHARLHDGWWRW
jgi:branched-chain amino acid transport system permease protein